jgi:hypothetical protein
MNKITVRMICAKSFMRTYPFHTYLIHNFNAIYEHNSFEFTLHI